MDHMHGQEGLVYQPLPRGNFIRCLVLEAGQSAQPLRCRLETRNLDNARGPETLLPWYYYAISYVWGTNVKSKTILCNDKKTYITPNLFEALHRIRERFNQQIVLWADSLCINQDDEEEKSHQVALMGQIYARASRVLIHMAGNDEGHAQKAESLIRERDAYVRQNLRLLQGIRSMWHGFPRLSPEERERIITDKRWTSFDRMLSQPWFNRGWVIQEAALGQGADILWGGEIITWEQLIRCASWISHRCLEVQGEYMRHGSNMTCHILVYLERYRKEAIAYRHITDCLDIAAILNLARETEITDPKDRVFAFLSLGVLSRGEYSGIYQEKPKMRVTYLSLLSFAPLLVFLARNWSGILGPEAWSLVEVLMSTTLCFFLITYPAPLFRPFFLVSRIFNHILETTPSETFPDPGPGRLMKPDYGKSKEEVYTEFARLRMLYGDIRILHFAQEHGFEGVNKQNALPSWVPRWDLTGDDNHRVPDPWLGRPLCPSQRFGGNLTRECNGRRLALTGVIFDRVSTRASFLKPKPELSAVVELLRVVNRMDVGNAYPAEERLAIMLDCLCATRIPFDVDFTAWADERQALINLLQSCNEIAPIKACEEDFPLLQNVLKHNPGGSPFFTDRGLFGVAYTRLVEGDVCAIVFGCSFHIIMRPTANHPVGEQPQYNIVGSACIVGSQEDVAVLGHARPSTSVKLIGRNKGSKDWVKWGLREQDIIIV